MRGLLKVNDEDIRMISCSSGVIVANFDQIHQSLLLAFNDFFAC